MRPSLGLALQLLGGCLTARAGSGPSVPAFRYASRCRTGNSARNPESSTNRENTPMSGAPEQARCGSRPRRSVERAEMTRFMRFAGERRGAPFADYDELWRWSVAELEEFWASIWEFCGVRASKPYEQVLELVATMPGARWFEGAELNYAENILLGDAS